MSAAISSTNPLAFRAAAVDASTPRSDKPQDPISKRALEALTTCSQWGDATHQSEKVKNILQLKPTAADLPIFLPPRFTLALTAPDLKMLQEIFERWALTSKLSLPEVWGVDLFTLLEELEQYLNPKAKSKLKQLFCSDFILGYLSMIAAVEMQRDPEVPQMSFFQRNKPHPKETLCLLLSLEEWALSLEEMRMLLPKALISRTKEACVCLAKILNRLSLGCNLLRHKDALIFLCDFNLVALKEYFPQASALCNASPEKTLQDLCTYARFVYEGFNEGCKARKLSVLTEVLESLPVLLNKMQKGSNKLKSANEFKQLLAHIFLDFQQKMEQHVAHLDAANSGKLTHEQYCKQLGIAVALKKSQEDFVASLYFKVTQFNLMNGFIHDFLDILDEQVLEPLYPDFISTEMAFRRAELNLRHYFEIAGMQLIAPDRKIEIPSHPALSLEQNSALQALLEAMHKDMHGLMNKVKMFPTDLVWSIQLFSQLINQKRIFLNAWIPLFNSFEPIMYMINKHIPELEGHRKRHLAQIQAFFKMLDVKQLNADKERWILFFKELCFTFGLDFCRISMLAKDIEAVTKMNVDLSAMNSEEHLLAQELVQYMDLEGLEELIEDLLQPAFPRVAEHKVPLVSMTEPTVHPMREELADRPFKPKPILLIQPKKEEVASDSQGSCCKRFVFSSREKARKLLQRLKDAGIIPCRIRGSHHVTDSKERKSVSIPVHGGGSHLKPGLARALTRQINAEHKV